MKNAVSTKVEGKTNKIALSHTRNISKKMQEVHWILLTQRRAIKQNINCLEDIKMLFSSRSV